MTSNIALLDTSSRVRAAISPRFDTEMRIKPSCATMVLVVHCSDARVTVPFSGALCEHVLYRRILDPTYALGARRASEEWYRSLGCRAMGQVQSVRKRSKDISIVSSAKSSGSFLSNGITKLWGVSYLSLAGPLALARYSAEGESSRVEWYQRVYSL